MIKFKKLNKFVTTDFNGKENGFVVPIYNNNDEFFEDSSHVPKQVYLTTVLPLTEKGPHKHFIRQGCFCCIKGNVKIVLKVEDEYKELYSGELYDYNLIIIPRGIPALIINECDKDEALLLNMPDPAWTAEMNDEFTEDFSEYYGK